MADGRGDRIAFALMRAGTSKGVCLLASDLPKEKRARDESILKVFSNPDPGQMEGLIGGAPWTNVVALVSPSTSHSATGGVVEVCFGRILPEGSGIDYTTVSGDFVAAAAQFAIDRGMVPSGATISSVQVIDQTNQVTAVVDLPIYKPQVQGTASRELIEEPFAKVTFTGLDSQRHNFFPTGQQREGVASAFGEYVVSIVDAVAPVVFINAEFLGLTGPELPEDLEEDEDFFEHVESIRAAVAEMLGYVDRRDRAWEKSPMRPRVVSIFEATEYDDIYGRFISSMDFDLICREVSLEEVHYALDLEVAVGAAVAAHMDGTVVWDALLREDAPRVVRLGHPSGAISVEVAIDWKNGAATNISATAEIPVQRILDGYVYLPMGRAA